MSTNVFLDVEKFKDQIPYYLTQPQKEGLARALEDFPENTNYYLSNYPVDLRNAALQGDVFKQLTIYGPQGSRQIKGIILSNSCDIDTQNKREFPMRAVFAPLIKLDAMVEKLRSAQIPQGVIDQKLDAIKKQLVTNVVYLPECEHIPESIIFLDDVHQIPTEELRKSLERQEKILTLSQVGFYILLFKLSIHFCRFHENVARYDN
ncbi:hypothetical protein NFJ31_09680 [Citrobacter freundii]|uniref:hypothetical protein n=1 Tax=Citrobacter freundii TaxID=546 RepID=UPI0005CCDEA9|nr:hypothetical protein [Citrobacter freundii]EKY0656242.1 hypothetical protein [Citrobacter freundii]ELT9544246.1 hypothetical protein [Citrobacter freundii]KJC10440.1 hypothetical protein TO64_02880 [Citrobacter freundii]OCF81846.1 hypothetical protein AS299_23240 [Citrobacter freundii]WFV38718.1 hypothetical protein NFJ31_09680 [Citrobacter freundii]